LRYRTEIDGLRALAVVPVILFHAGFELFSGGFVGVDVFFVISGYLITTILIEDIENKRFSIVNFYERRARRILPALFFVMLACIPLAWMWMLPSQMMDFSQSLVAVGLFVSNILFWREGGYFAAAAEEKPLLHTWSLAVEEQYYVLFPIFLILAWRFGKNRVFFMIVVMAIISLLMSEWGWRNKPTASFYLAPTRVWELFSGSLAAFIVWKQGVKKNNTLAFAGLVAIVFSIFFYDKTTPFPSVYALMPVIGVLLLILYADNKTLAARLLSTKPIVGIGLISYSAYLWHQPLFAFARIRMIEEPSLYVMSALSILTVILAFFSWKFIENPLRNKRFFSRGAVFSFGFVAICAFSLFGLFGIKQNGFEGRFTEGDLSFLQQINEENSNYVIERFNSFKAAGWGDKKIKVFLVGDSYAQDLTNAVYESDIFDDVSLSTWHISARCGNLYVPFNEKKEFISEMDLSMCINNDYFGDEVFIDRLKGADEVWFASSWRAWQIELIGESLGNVEGLSPAVIRVFGRKDFSSFEPRNYLSLTAKERSELSEPISAEQIELNYKLSVLVKDYNFIDVQRLICGGSVSECKVFDDSGQLKTYDGGHLTKAGAKFYGNYLSEYLGNL